MNDVLKQLVCEAIDRFNSLTPEEQASHRKAQGESWVAGEMVFSRLTMEPTGQLKVKQEKVAPLTFIYRNWRGEVSERQVIPHTTRFGTSDWHTEPQWLLRAWDIDKNAEREFAMSDMLPDFLMEVIGKIIERTEDLDDSTEKIQDIRKMARAVFAKED